jgi:hypothetical protein
LAELRKKETGLKAKRTGLGRAERPHGDTMEEGND